MEMISVQTMMHILTELDIANTSVALSNEERFIYYRPSKFTYSAWGSSK